MSMKDQDNFCTNKKINRIDDLPIDYIFSKANTDCKSITPTYFNDVKPNDNASSTCIKICLNDIAYDSSLLQFKPIKYLDDSSIATNCKSNVDSIHSKKTLPIEKIKELSRKLNQKINEKKEKERLKKEIDRTLSKTGYLIEEQGFNDSKAKVKRISLHRQPYNKEFPSAKQYKENDKSLPKYKEDLENYSIIKKRIISTSEKKRFSVNLELNDYYNSKKTLFFKYFADEEIGISEFIQCEMTESVADEDVESNDDLISSSTMKIKKDLYEVIDMINKSGVEFNLRNKCKFAISKKVKQE